MKLPFSGLWSEFKAFAFKGNMIELAVAVIIGGAFGTVVSSLTSDIIMPTIGYVIHKGQETAIAAKDKLGEAASVVASKTGLATTRPATSQPATSQPSTPVVAAGTTPAASPPAGPPVTSADLKPATDGVTDAVAIFKELEAQRDAKDAAAAKAKADADAKAKATEPIKIDLMVGPVPVGKFIGALLNFFIVAFAVFLMVVKLMGGVMKRMSKPTAPGEPTTRECPECLSIIPIKARRCSHCTAVIIPPATA
jgi:large-conductance mechanosensitive channel